MILQPQIKAWQYLILVCIEWGRARSGEVPYHPDAILTGPYHPDAILTGPYHPDTILTGTHHPDALLTESYHPNALLTGSYYPSRNPPLKRF